MIKKRSMSHALLLSAVLIGKPAMAVELPGSNFPDQAKFDGGDLDIAMGTAVVSLMSMSISPYLKSSHSQSLPLLSAGNFGRSKIAWRLSTVETKQPWVLGEYSAGFLPPIGGDDGGGGGGTTAMSPIKPEEFAMSPGGVDMRTGEYVYRNVDLQIGDGESSGGFELTRILPHYIPGFKDHLGLNFSHSWDIFITETRVQVQEANTPSQYDYVMSVNFGGRSKTFRSLWSNIDLYRQQSYSTYGNLTINDLVTSPVGTKPHNARYRYTAPDGTIVNFRSINGSVVGGQTLWDCASPARCAYASDITLPNGIRYDLSYDYAASTVSGNARLRRVTSNTGYMMIFEYHPINASGFNLISKVCTFNTAKVAAPAGNTCPVQVPTVNYSYTGNFLTSVTDPLGGVSRFTATSYTKPGESQPYLVNGVDPNVLVKQAVATQTFSTGETYSYTWDIIDELEQSIGPAGGTFTDKLGKTVAVRYGKYPIPNSNDPTKLITPGPESVTDALGRVTRYNYCVPYSGVSQFEGDCVVSPLQSATMPGGNSIYYEYDTILNVTKITNKPVPGTGQADLVETRAYTCYNDTCRSKPTRVVDARGNVTDYVYDPVHGGVLSETGPSVGGVRPQKRYEYGQRYAWVKNASGGYVRAASPIWVLTKEEYCKTSAASGSGCAAGASDEVVTAYDYGPDSGPNNLLLRGMAVTADGQTLRTCFAYDDLGRRISETQPLANLTACP